MPVVYDKLLGEVLLHTHKEVVNINGLNGVSWNLTFTGNRLTSYTRTNGLEDYDYTLAYAGGGIRTLTKTVGTKTYERTITYDVNQKMATVSAWVEL